VVDGWVWLAQGQPLWSRLCSKQHQPQTAPSTHLSKESQPDVLGGGVLLQAGVELVVTAVQAHAHALAARALVAGPATLVGLEVLGADGNHGGAVVTLEAEVAGGLVAVAGAVDRAPVDGGATILEALLRLSGGGSWPHAHLPGLAPVAPAVDVLDSARAQAPLVGVTGRLVHALHIGDLPAVPIGECQGSGGDGQDEGQEHGGSGLHCGGCASTWVCRRLWGWWGVGCAGRDGVG